MYRTPWSRQGLYGRACGPYRPRGGAGLTGPVTILCSRSLSGLLFFFAPCPRSLPPANHPCRPEVLDRRGCAHSSLSHYLGVGLALSPHGNDLLRGRSADPLAVLILRQVGHREHPRQSLPDRRYGTVDAGEV